MLQHSPSSSNLMQHGRMQLRSTAKEILAFLLHILQRVRKKNIIFLYWQELFEQKCARGARPTDKISKEQMKVCAVKNREDTQWEATCAVPSLEARQEGHLPALLTTESRSPHASSGCWGNTQLPYVCRSCMRSLIPSFLLFFSRETQLEITCQSKITKPHILSQSLFQEERRLCVKEMLTSEVWHQKNVLHGLNRSIHFSYMHRFTLTPVRLSYERTLFT